MKFESINDSKFTTFNEKQVSSKVQSIIGGNYPTEVGNLLDKYETMNGTTGDGKVETTTYQDDNRIP